MSLSPPPVSLSLPAANPKKRTSIASVTSNSSQPSKKPRMHPLRQTSFPVSADNDPRVYTGTSTKSEVDGGSVTGSFTGSFAGSLDGGVKGRRKKGKKARDTEGSVKGGGRRSVKDGSTKAGTVTGEDDGEVDEEDEYDDADLMGGDGGPAIDADAEKENLAILIDAFSPTQSSRYDLFKRAKLNKPTLRKIVNQTLSQSVPPNVVTTVGGYSKIFIGEIVEKARTVQEEWANAADNAAISAAEEQAAQLQSKLDQAKDNDNKKETPTDKQTAATSATTAAASPGQSSPAPKLEEPKTEEVTVKAESQQENGEVNIMKSFSSPTQSTTQATPPSFSPSGTATAVETNTTNAPEDINMDSEMKSFKLPPNPHRGPLLPSHIREALRRYRRDGEGGNVGFSGLSMKGLGVKGAFSWNVRGIGGRLFR